MASDTPDTTRTDPATPDAPTGTPEDRANPEARHDHDHPHDHEHDHDHEHPDEPKAEAKLKQNVEIHDAGPCKKHIKVTVERPDIDARFEDKYKELAKDHRTTVDGFRPGKAPRVLLVRRFQKDVKEQVRAEVLMASLEQLAEDNNLNPLSPPDIDPGKIDIPDEGPMVYEFDVEVRPEFELANYKELKLKRPTYPITDADVEREEKRILEGAGQIVPKPGDPPVVDLGDIITADITTRYNGKVIHTVPEARLRVDSRLALKDGVAENFGDVMKGAKDGETRTVDIVLSGNVADQALRGQTVQADFHVNDIKTVRLPELTPALLDSFGVRSQEQLRELIRVSLERRLEYAQRQSARTQVLEQLAGDANWELPQDLLRRQARRTLQRRVMEMRNAGMAEDEIAGRQRLLQQDVLQSTANALKEHFVLQKIAELEKIEIQEEDIDEEIERLASRSDESPRKVRARLEREDLIETLATELLERKALDLVLSSAEYTDEALNQADTRAASETVATVEAQASPGELTDMSQEEPKAEEAKAETEEKAEGGESAEGAAPETPETPETKG
jgi:trigger factor